MKEANITETRIDTALVNKAVHALQKHHMIKVDSSDKQSLLGTDVPIQVLLSLEVAPGQRKPKPIRISIPHPIYKISEEEEGDSMDNSDLEDAEVCLIVKEESKPAIQEMIRQFPRQLGCIKKVLGLQSLRTKHAEYKKRRDLLARFTTFLADDRILPMLQSALGKDFVLAKKLPIPIRVTRPEALPFTIQNALRSTYLHINKGTCLLLKVGTTGMSTDKLVENVVAAIEGAVPHIPRKWANLRQVSIKLPASQSLPVYNKTPLELQEIAQLAGLSPVWGDIKREQIGSRTKPKEVMTKSEDVKLTVTNIKSPLLKALKKQKKMEISTVEKKNNLKQKKSESSAVDKKDKPQKQRTNTSTVENTSREDKVASSEIIETSKKAKRERSKTEKPVVKKTQNIAQSDDLPSPKKRKQEVFIASSKYQGSKAGFIFKKDRLGLGYYADVPPKVDPTALSRWTSVQKGAKKKKQQQKQQRRG